MCYQSLSFPIYRYEIFFRKTMLAEKLKILCARQKGSFKHRNQVIETGSWAGKALAEISAIFYLQYYFMRNIIKGNNGNRSTPIQWTRLTYRS